MCVCVCVCVSVSLSVCVCVCFSVACTLTYFVHVFAVYSMQKEICVCTSIHNTYFSSIMCVSCVSSEVAGLCAVIP